VPNNWPASGHVGSGCGGTRKAGESDRADVLLAQCRSELAESWTSVGGYSNAGTLAALWVGAAVDGAATAWSGAMLVFFGFCWGRK